MKILVLNGPNINILGIREPEIYGRQSYKDLLKMISGHAEEKGVTVEFYQSNHEGDLVDAIQRAYFDGIDGIVFNPAAYTHTSVAIADAVKGRRYTDSGGAHLRGVRARGLQADKLHPQRRGKDCLRPWPCRLQRGA